jgi:hypothetical protein
VLPEGTFNTPPKTTELRPIGPATRISIQNQPSALRRYWEVSVVPAKYHQRYRYRQSSRRRSSSP